MESTYLKRKKSQRIILFGINVFIDIFFVSLLLLEKSIGFNQRFGIFGQLDSTLKAIFGAFFGLSFIFSLYLFKDIFFDYNRNIDYKYEDLVNDIEVKYSILRMEFNNQKYEILKNLKETEENELIKERLKIIELQSLKLQQDKIDEIKKILEIHVNNSRQ